MSKSVKRWLLYAALVLAAKLLLGLILLLNSPVDLAPDEAQYWCWSQDLDIGYYSKPPAIAWQIAFTTALFGNTPLGVRIGALLMSLLLAALLYLFAPKFGLSQRASLWVLIVASFMPMALFLSFSATTDLGALLFLTLALLTTALVLRPADQPPPPKYWLIGLWICCGALYKWTAFAFWPLLLLAWVFFPPLRHRSVWQGFAISLLGLLPSFFWNAQHEWVTFRHVFSTLLRPKGATESTHVGNFGDFLGAQIGAFSPIFFLLFLYALFLLYRKRGEIALRFISLFPTVILLYVIAALFKKMQPNWAFFLYAPTFLLIPWAAFRSRHPRLWLHLGLWSSLLLFGGGLAIPYIQAHTEIPLSYRLNPLRQSLGWRHLTAALEEAGYRPERDFLFADKYQMSSLLSFYGPGQKRAYFFNLLKMRKNQFSYWTPMSAAERGKRGYFVMAENRVATPENLALYRAEYLRDLAPYFTRVTLEKCVPLFEAGGRVVKFALIFVCEEYQGGAPSDPAKY